MKIYSYVSYRDYLNERINQKDTRGQAARLAEATGIHTSILSQVIRGRRDLTNEQTVALTDYFGLNDNETAYLLLLVQHERAGTEKLKIILNKQIEQLRAQVDMVSSRVPKSATLTDHQKSTFYSAWFYSGIRILTSIPSYQTLESLRQKLRLPRKQIQKALDFLSSTDLVIEKDGKYSIGVKSTHLSSASPHIHQHHANWRIRAIERNASLQNEKEIAFTSPMSLSKKDALIVRGKLLQFIEEACAISDPSPAETAYCLNLDWFEI